jgi:hypothetical protein
MNGRQAAKLAAKKIEELEHYNARSKADITAYNRVVLGLIEGDLNPCDWCEENADCERQIKGKGCSEWWLAYKLPMKEEEADDSEGVPLVGSEGRT